MLLIGLVHRPHGLRGEVSVEPRTDFPERFVPGLRLLWMAGTAQRHLTVLSVRPHGRRLLVSFEGIGDVESAGGLSGGELCVPEDGAARSPEDHYYAFEIEGWRCEDRAGRRLGSAAGLEETPAGPLLSVRTEAGRTALVPFVRPIVVEVDRASRRIVLDPPEGLMEL
jgi:16S rRNA processing protein RimM